MMGAGELPVKLVITGNTVLPYAIPIYRHRRHCKKKLGLRFI